MLGRKLKIAAGVIAALAVIVPMTTASAAIQELEFTNTSGSITVGTLPAITVDAGNAGLSGTWDDVTGDFIGTTTFNPITIPANPPTIPISVVVQLINEPDNVTGTIDPTDGTTDLTATMQFQLTIPGEPPIVCTTPEFDVDFPDSEPFAPLPFDESADYTLTLDGEFTLPAFGVDCALAATINPILGLPAGGTAVLGLVRGTPAPPTTPTTAAPTTTSTAAAAAATSPRFTG